MIVLKRNRARGKWIVSILMFFFSEDLSFIRFNETNLQKITVIGLGLIVLVALIGHLKKVNDSLREEDGKLKIDLKGKNAALEENIRKLEDKSRK